MTNMTPEEINQRIATWMGWTNVQRSRRHQGRLMGNMPERFELIIVPDYFQSNAAIDLLGVLVERGYTYKMLGAPGTHYMAIGDSTGYCPMAATKCQKTPSAAICTAIIELIEREGK